MSQKPTTYTGELFEPIRVDGPNPVPGGIRGAQDRKLLLLLEHFGIDQTSEDRWKELARALAVAHVPGFELGPYGRSINGRPKVWHSKSYFQLWFAVWWMCKKSGVSESEACRLLSRQPIWRERGSESVLRRRLVDAKNCNRARAEMETFWEYSEREPEKDLGAMMADYLAFTFMTPPGE